MPIHKTVAVFLYHPRLSEINAPVGYQEVAGHDYEWLLLIGYLRRILTNQQWGLVGMSVTSWYPTGALISDNQG